MIAILFLLTELQDRAFVSPSQSLCPEPKLESGFVEVVGAELKTGSVAYYICNKTRSLQDKKVFARYCLENGRWSGIQPSCDTSKKTKSSYSICYT